MDREYVREKKRRERVSFSTLQIDSLDENAIETHVKSASRKRIKSTGNRASRQLSLIRTCHATRDVQNRAAISSKSPGRIDQTRAFLLSSEEKVESLLENVI